MQPLTVISNLLLQFL